MSERKNRVIEITTRNALENYQLKTPEGLQEAGDGIYEATIQAYDENNFIIVDNKAKRWKYPDDLFPSQIAILADAAFDIRLVRVSSLDKNGDKSNCILAIYVNRLVIDIAGNEYEKYYGTYRSDESLFDTILNFIGNVPSTRDLKEVKSILCRTAKIVDRTTDDYLIPVNNGVFDYRKGKKILNEFSPDFVFLSKARINYNPMAANPILTLNDGTPWDYDSWVTDLPDNLDCVDLLKYQIPLALLRCNKKWKKAIFLKGSKGCGAKSTLTKLWTNLLGEETVCSIPLGDFGKDFMLEPLINSQAVICDESDTNTYLKTCSAFKSVITNDPVRINRKGLKPITYTFHGLVVMNLNSSFRCADTSDSLTRRFLYLAMNKCFVGHEYSEIKDEFMGNNEVLEYVMRIALESNVEELDNPPSCELELNDFKTSNDIVRSFWLELRPDFSWSLLPYDLLFTLFRAWSDINNPEGRTKGKTKFCEDLRSVIDQDPDWTYDKNKNQVKVIVDGVNRMDGPEPLVLKYNLSHYSEEWVNTEYRGTNKALLATPALADKYRGIERVMTTKKI